MMPGLKMAIARIVPLLVAAGLPAMARAQAVVTYHNDLLRTGWDIGETSLTVANVSGGGFNLLASTTLDSQVDSQPLVVPNQVIGSQGAHTVVYVVTGGDTLYAIDGISGAILASRNFGTPVPQSSLPGQCNNNGPSVGITSTPVISIAKGTLYLIADTYENGKAVFRVHAVSLSTLQDTIPAVVVTASSTLADGTSYVFNPTGSRQRAALLLSGSTLYAGFSSYCDQAQNTTRGWLLGWNTTGLKPLAHNNLTDATSTSQSNYFLNSIWMSGFGPATASANNTVYVVTSNSDKNTYGAANRDESVLELSADLSGTPAFFTDPNHAKLDDGDTDFGAGGAMLPPPQPGENPKLLLAAGKSGTMYMFDRSAGAGLGVLGTYSIGGCWCGPSYYKGSDRVGRVVSSGGSSVIVWRLNTSTTAPASLSKQNATQITSGQEGGFFTSISSSGTKPGTAIIWAVGRPTSAPGKLPLYAIDPTSGKILYTATAGNWVSGNSNANTVPTISGGHVYVASYQTLSIFGLGAAPTLATRSAMIARTRAADAVRPTLALASGEHAVWGTIGSVTQTNMTLTDRHGKVVRIYLSTARANGDVAAPMTGQAALVIGTLSADGQMLARHVEHAKQSPALWGDDQ